MIDIFFKLYTFNMYNTMNLVISIHLLIYHHQQHHKHIHHCPKFSFYMPKSISLVFAKHCVHYLGIRDSIEISIHLWFYMLPVNFGDSGFMIEEVESFWSVLTWQFSRLSTCLVLIPQKISNPRKNIPFCEHYRNIL